MSRMLKAAVLAAVIAGGTTAGTAAGAEMEASAYVRCPTGAVIRVRGGVRPECDLDGTQSLTVTYPGSDGIERRHFRRLADQWGGRLRWVIPGGDLDRGHWEIEDIDY